MRDPKAICVQCGQSREDIKSEGFYCATVDAATENGAGEVNAEWPRHRFKPYSPKELAEQAAQEKAYCEYLGGFADFCQKRGRWADQTPSSPSGTSGSGE